MHDNGITPTKKSQITGLVALKKEFASELKSISDWWKTNTQDEIFGGFLGEISATNQIEHCANKGIVLNTRILWFFSEEAIFNNSLTSRAMATRAYKHIIEHFDDPVHGGVFWELDHAGKVIDDKKQTYAQAFAIYAFVSYYKLTGEQTAIDNALRYFELVEQHTFDTELGGYLEAFSNNWQALDDMRLSEKDANFPKTMNTHLHVLEAYTNLQNVYPTAQVKHALIRLVNYFNTHIVNQSNYHLRLFMCRQWGDYSTEYSYGHDIEGSWLLHKALSVLQNKNLTDSIMPTVLGLARVCRNEGISDEGHVFNEIDIITGKIHTESCWWVQAEAMVGFLNAYKYTHDEAYLRAFNDIWLYVKKQHIDKENGEWHWFGKSDQTPCNTVYKVGFWKGPYHNGRALMEVISLLDKLSNDNVSTGPSN